jgi:uncharacterized damage-inducible protein DinB
MATTTEHPDLLAQLRSTLKELPALLERLPSDRLYEAPGPGEWSAAGVLAHLADAEQVYGVRLKMIVAADRPTLVAYDQEDWERLYGPLETVETALERWKALRQSNLRLLESLDEAGWQRIGMHAERGEESVERIGQILAEHDRGHMQQMETATRPT